MTDLYQRVPKDPIENVKFRQYILTACKKDRFKQQALRHACYRDILFYFNTFVWTYDPRVNPSVVPFITYGFQDRAILDIVKAIEDGEPLLIQKSRDMGASWISLGVMDYLAQFRKNMKFLMMSRSAGLVDMPGEPDALFWKIDFIHKHLPPWILNRKKELTRRKMSFSYSRTDANVTGSATTETSGIGGRATAVFIDELSRYDPVEAKAIMEGTHDTSNCLIYNFTPAPGSGQSHPSYELVKQANKGNLRSLKLYWADHPVKAIGHYTYDPKTKVLEIIDKGYEFPKGYNFQMDGRFFNHSIWFDKERIKRANDNSVAEMMEIDYLGSSHLVFDAEMIRNLSLRFARRPDIEGDLAYDRTTGIPQRFFGVKNGPIKLWMNLDGAGIPPLGPYAKAADIGLGQNATNSVFTAALIRTGEMVLEFAVANLDPREFAVKCVALCRWLDKPSPFDIGTFAWEMQGPGEAFGNKVIEMGYNNVYFRTEEMTIDRAVRQNVPGWYPSPRNKRLLLEEYREMLNMHDFINRSEIGLEEHLEWIHTSSGVEHQSNKNRRIDPSGATVNHGDRVISAALCAKMVRHHGGGAIAEKTLIKPGCVAWMMEQEEIEAAQYEDFVYPNG